MPALLVALLTALTPTDPGTPPPASAPPSAERGAEADALVARAAQHMDAGEWREALALLQSPAARQAGAATALLRGICHYELGEDAPAREALQAARGEPELAPSAELFLGLIAQRQGRAQEAAAAFDAVMARDAGGTLGAAADTLRRRAEREGRLSLAVALGAGYDSNLLLLPPGTNPTPLPADAAGHASVGLALQPWGAVGPFARAGVSGRRQARLNTFDTAGAQAGAGWRFGSGALRGTAEYGWEGLLLGGVPFLDTHQLTLSAGWQPAGTGVEATYALRQDAFHTRSSGGYSGVRHTGVLELQHAFSDALAGRLGYGAGVSDTADPALAFLEHGPRAGVSARLGRGVRLALDARLLRRDYAPVAGRQDVQLDAVGTLEVDLHPRWTMHAELATLQVGSSVATRSYTTFAGGLSLQYAGALF